VQGVYHCTFKFTKTGTVFRELIVLIVLLPSLVFAQNNLSGAKMDTLSTPDGKPLGDIATTKIDSKGGYFKSKDGKLEIIFPADALDTETPISIQAIYNELTEDDSDSYQLEPSGLTFKKPVQLIFHYTGGNENADLKSIAWQDDAGQWH